MELQPYRVYTPSNIRQLELLVDFVQQNPYLAIVVSRHKHARMKASRLWAECAQRLNTEGPEKTARTWAQVWQDNKNRVRLKARSNGLSSLTPLEARILGIYSKMHKIIKETLEIEKQTYKEPGPARRRFSSMINDDTEPEVLEDYEVLKEERLSVASTATPTPDQESQEPANQLKNKCQIDKASTLLKIEQTRAEAELKNAEALCSFAESFGLIADCIDRLSRKYCED